MLRLLGFLMLLAAAPASAQGWETFSHDLGAGAAVCPYDDPDTGDFFCFAVACLPGETVPYIRIGISGGGITQLHTPLQVQVDGSPVARMFLTQLSDDGMRDYGIPVDPDRDAALIEALRTGRKAIVIFGMGLDAVVQEISLSGSQVAIDQVSAMCHSAPLTARVAD